MERSKNLDYQNTYKVFYNSNRKKTKNDTELHTAAKFGDVDFVENVMIINPELITKTNVRGQTALHCAFWCGENHIVDILVRSLIIWFKNVSTLYYFY